MNKSKLLLATLLATISFAAYGQGAAPVRGEVSAGVYENIKSTSQALNVNVSSGVAIANNSNAFGHTAVSVLVTSTTLVGGNAARKYTQIQNQDAANPIYVKCDGTAATADNASVKIAAGQTWTPTVSSIMTCTGIATGGTVATNVTFAN